MKTVREQMIEQAISNCSRLSRNIIRPIAQNMSISDMKKYVPISQRENENPLDNFWNELGVK
jgi:hypothetical protein